MSRGTLDRKWYCLQETKKKFNLLLLAGELFRFLFCFVLFRFNFMFWLLLLLIYGAIFRGNKILVCGLVGQMTTLLLRNGKGERETAWGSVDCIEAAAADGDPTQSVANGCRVQSRLVFLLSNLKPTFFFRFSSAFRVSSQ